LADLVTDGIFTQQKWLVGMALLNKLDPQVIASRLAAWLPGVRSGTGDVALTDLQTPRASGMSSETGLFDAAWESDGQRISKGMVVRIPPSDQGLFNDYDIAPEGRVMAAIASHSDAAVPAVLAQELTVMVCKATDPGWASLFPLAQAVITDVGSALSHAAIVCRELGLPCVANTRTGTRHLRDGMRVRVNGSTGVVDVLDTPLPGQI
jgi:phosphohistidine swiveling domain-containing protein